MDDILVSREIYSNPELWEWTKKELIREHGEDCLHRVRLVDTNLDTDEVSVQVLENHVFDNVLEEMQRSAERRVKTIRDQDGKR